MPEKSPSDQDGCAAQHQRREDASLGAERPAGQPGGLTRIVVDERDLERQPAHRGIHRGQRPVPSEVQARGGPDPAGGEEHRAEQQPGDADIADAEGGDLQVPRMGEREGQRGDTHGDAATQSSIEHDDGKLLFPGSQKLVSPREPLDCGNSGSTMRILAGVLAGHDLTAELIGDESLSTRPMRRIIEPLELMGAQIEATEGKPPLRIRGSGNPRLSDIKRGGIAAPFFIEP